MAEKRHVCESQYWGREPLVQREVPAFWSVDAHGQPCNDVRLTIGAGARWRIEGPRPLSEPPVKKLGPASQELESLRRSLKDGRFAGESVKLTEAQREELLTSMPPHHQIHALRLNFDRDTHAEAFR